MIDFLKQWANSLLCLGIFIAIVEMSLPKGNIKKYIYVLIGLITLIVIISPFISKDNYQNMIDESIAAISKNVEYNQNNSINIEDYSNYQENMVKNEYINNIKKSIWNDLVSKGVIIDSINILINDDYSVTKLDIYIKEYGNSEYKSKQEVLNYIKKYYEIAENLINIIKVNEVEVYGK